MYSHVWFLFRILHEDFPLKHFWQKFDPVSVGQFYIWSFLDPVLAYWLIVLGLCCIRYIDWSNPACLSIYYFNFEPSMESDQINWLRALLETSILDMPGFYWLPSLWGKYYPHPPSGRTWLLSLFCETRAVCCDDVSAKYSKEKDTCEYDHIIK